MAVEIVILRWISSSSKSVIVLPSSTRRRRLVAPAVNSNPAVSVVLPESPWPTTPTLDRKSTRLNSSHLGNSHAVFSFKKKSEPDGLRGRLLHFERAPDVVAADRTT